MSLILMDSNTSPYDVFKPEVATHIKDTGDCWIWQGRVNRRGSPIVYSKPSNIIVTSLAYRLVNEVDSTTGVKTVAACETPLCVHPEHLTRVSSVVGIMLKVKHGSVMDGDCWIWQGPLNGPSESPRVWTESNWLAVRKFVYTVEHGLPYDIDIHVAVPTCGDHRCVSFKHLESDRGATLVETL